MDKLRPITKEEWESYEWVEVTTMGEDDIVFIKGIKISPQSVPDDGFVYKKILTRDACGNYTRIYKRVMTYDSQDN